MYLAQTLVALVALLHLGFLVLEMFLWTSPIGRKVFGMNAEKAELTKVMAANQGLYNGFLVAGLLWGLLLGTSGVPVMIDLLPQLRHRRRGLWRRYGQPQDFMGAGRTGHCSPGSAWHRCSVQRWLKANGSNALPVTGERSLGVKEPGKSV